MVQAEFPPVNFPLSPCRLIPASLTRLIVPVKCLFMKLENIQTK